MQRVFIAVNVHPESELLRMFSSLRAQLGAEKIKWVDPENIHLTLAFLGDTEEKKIKIIAGILKERCNGFQEFEFVLAGAGVFKNYSDPRVIWAGIELSEKLMMLNNIITEGLREYGFVVEDRPFNPHLTLGRIKSLRDTENLKSALEKYRDVVFQRVEVNEVTFYESILMKTGPIYRVLGTFGV